MLNRAALLVRCRQPFVDWINGVDPATDRIVTLREANDEGTVYLLEVEDHDELEAWLEINHEMLFENELHAWYIDPMLWPTDRSLRQLRRWCDLELHTVVLDIGTTPITQDL